jgi:maleylpyruvate isomerase
MDTSADLPELDETCLATTRYLQALTQLDDDSVRRPSVLPGWSRAHVVAHLSRNADALARVLAQAAAGEPASMYASSDDRDRDIEETVAGSDRDRLVEDAHSSAARLETALRAGGAPPGATYTRVPGGTPAFPVAAVGARRRAEVEIHHADLDIGYAPADWPPDFSLAIIEQRRDELAAQAQGCPSMVLSSTDVEGRWTFGEGDGPQVVGSAGDLAWWLVGRGGGHGLTSSAALPTLGRWR